MNISKKYRSWLLGAALLLTVAATASVNNLDNPETDVVLPEISAARGPHASAESAAATGLSEENLVEQLKRPALPEKVKDMFVAKSWYVPPPVSRVVAPPSAPALPFVYVGKMLEEGKSSIVFLEKQNRVFLVREGDVIDSSYRVDTINAPVMTLTYLPLDIKQIVRIGEAK